MAYSAEIDSVTTADVAPTAAPYRISAQPTKDEVVVAYHGEHDGAYIPPVWPGFVPDVPGEFIAVRVQQGGVGPYSGENVGKVGRVCSANQQCGDGDTCHAPVRIDPDDAQDLTIAYSAFTGEADGDVDINVYMNLHYVGWTAV